MSKSTAADAVAQNGVISDENLDFVSAGFDADAYASKISKYSEQELKDAYEAAHITLRALNKGGFRPNSDSARIFKEHYQQIQLMKAEYDARHIEPPFRS